MEVKENTLKNLMVKYFASWPKQSTRKFAFAFVSEMNKTTMMKSTFKSTLSFCKENNYSWIIIAGTEKGMGNYMLDFDDDWSEEDKAEMRKEMDFKVITQDRFQDFSQDLIKIIGSEEEQKLKELINT